MESRPETVSEPRFVVDEMLGKLARRLRMMGLDVEHKRPFPDEDLLDIAKKEARIIITRDRKLAAAGPPPEVWLLEEDLPFDQLVEVVKRVGLDLKDKAFTRCSLCNKLLVDVLKSEVAGKVPPFIFSTQTEYRRCPKCNKIYWPGTHRKHMEKIFEEVAKSVAALKS